MRNRDQWKPTKFDMVNGQLVPLGVGATSRHVASLQAVAYQRMIERYAHGRIADLGCAAVPLYVLYRTIDDDPLCVDVGDNAYDALHVDVQWDLNKHNLLLFGDTIIATDVIEHLHTPMSFFQTCADALTHGGHLLCASPFLYCLHDEPHDYHRYTVHALRHYCQEVGLDVVECEPYGDAFDVLTDMAHKTGSHPPPLGLERAAKFPLGYTLVARKP